MSDRYVTVMECSALYRKDGCRNLRVNGGGSDMSPYVRRSCSPDGLSWCWLRTVLLPPFYFLFTACSGTPPPNRPSPQDSTLVRDLEIQVGCSETRARVTVARVTWHSPPALHVRQRVDATVGADGFASGHYRSVLVLADARRFLPPDADVREQGPGRSLDSLVVARVVRSPDADSVVVDVEGLEPRVNYYWRVATSVEDEWVVGQAVRVQAPICVADIRNLAAEVQP